MSLLVQKFNPEDATDHQGKVLEDEIAFNKFNTRINKKNKTLLGKILMQLNSLKRRKTHYNVSRWESMLAYLPTLFQGTWNKLKFEKEVMHGDCTFLTADNTRFRCQKRGVYLVSSFVTLETTNWEKAYLGLFKNNVLYSYLRIRGCRLFDPVDVVWLYHSIIDLAGSLDCVFLDVGDEIDIRLFFIALVTGWQPTKFTGRVNIVYVGNNTRQINAPVDTWI